MIGRGKLYVVVNKDLRMSSGKTAAQVAHAVARLKLEVTPNTVIVLSGTTEQLHNLNTYLSRMDNIQDLNYHLYIDEGVNEVPPMSATALAFGVFAEDVTSPFIQDFKLLKSKRPLW